MKLLPKFMPDCSFSCQTREDLGQYVNMSYRFKYVILLSIELRLADSKLSKIGKGGMPAQCYAKATTKEAAAKPGRNMKARGRI